MVRETLYATWGSSGQNGITTNASAFSRTSKGGYLRCSTLRISQMRQSSLSECWHPPRMKTALRNQPIRQKDRNNMSLSRSSQNSSSTVRRNIKVSDHHPLDSGLRARPNGCVNDFLTALDQYVSPPSVCSQWCSDC